MSLASRGTRAAARYLQLSRTVQSPRRCASTEHGHGQGHGESALHLPHANPKGNEGIGSGLWITLASVPIFYIGYQLGYGSDKNFFGRQYQAYKEGMKAQEDADNLHEAILAQAIRDRARISSYPRETGGPDLKYPEMFNAGSPWNQAAGESSANLKALEQHYRKVNAELEEERIEKFRGARGKTVYD